MEIARFTGTYRSSAQSCRGCIAAGCLAWPAEFVLVRYPRNRSISIGWLSSAGKYRRGGDEYYFHEGFQGD